MDAILVCHGIGRQVRFETVDCIAQQLLKEHERRGGAAASVKITQCLGNDAMLLPRAELSWDGKIGKAQTTHIYEAYWAPIPAGRVCARDVTQFLFGSAWNGVRNTTAGQFDRWMFGKLQAFPSRSKSLMLAFVCLIVASLIWIMWAAGFALYVWHLGSQLKYYYGNWGTLNVTVPGVVIALAWLFSFILMIALRRVMIDYLGGLVAYVAAHDINRFNRIKDEIQKSAADVAAHIYSAKGLDDKPLYDRVIVLGHSLGSLVAYDALNRLIQLDIARNVDSSVPDRTKLFLTFGSPLDKTAFIFRTQQKGAPYREEYAAVKQPMIVSYLYRPMRWINLYSPSDIISGSLDYYDAPDGDGHDKRIENRRARTPSSPLRAHLSYWKGPDVRALVYDALEQP